jgi:hypothetical protein
VPRVVTLGYPAIIHSLQVLSQNVGHPMTVVRNAVTLEPGAIWDRDNILLAANTRTVVYARGDTVFEDDTFAFLANAYNSSMQRPLWMANLTMAQVGPVFGLAHTLSPWWGPRGSVCAWLNQFGTFYLTHRPDLELASRHAGLLLDGLFGLRSLWTTLFRSLALSMGDGGPQVFEKWIRPSDVGPFVGILLGSQGPEEIAVNRLPKAITSLRETPTEDFESCVSVPVFSMLIRRAETAAGNLAPVIEKLRAEL